MANKMDFEKIFLCHVLASPTLILWHHLSYIYKPTQSRLLVPDFIVEFCMWLFNPDTLRAAKRGLKILIILL